MPVIERRKYDQHQFNPRKSSQHELKQNLMLQSRKKDTFPCSKGELFLTIQFSNCCFILSPSLYLQIGRRNECRWNYRVWYVGPYFSCSQGGTRGQKKRGQGQAKVWQQSCSMQPLEQEPRWAGWRPEHQAGHWEAPGVCRTPEDWCKANHQPFPKASR